MSTQAVLFDRKKWSVWRAIIWLQQHKYPVYKVHSTAKYHRFRQLEPTFKRYVTKSVPGSPGVLLVLGFK